VETGAGESRWREVVGNRREEKTSLLATSRNHFTMDPAKKGRTNKDVNTKTLIVEGFKEKG